MRMTLASSGEIMAWTIMFSYEENIIYFVKEKCLYLNEINAFFLEN